VTFEIDWVIFVLADVAELAFRLASAFGVCDDDILLAAAAPLSALTRRIYFSSPLPFAAGD